MKSDRIIIEDDKIKVRKGHREIEKKWYERVEEPKKNYKRPKSNNRWWEEDCEDNEADGGL